MKQLLSWLWPMPAVHAEPMLIKEEDKRHEAWYEEARKLRPEEVGAFVQRLATSYQHDYGTICHACAAAALGAAHAVNHGPQGGITGFQAGAIMWEFVRHWQSYDGPMRLVRYEQLLYPQNVEETRTLTQETFKWLQEQARTKLRVGGSAHPDVVRHWERLAAGHVPKGYVLEQPRSKP